MSESQTNESNNLYQAAYIKKHVSTTLFGGPLLYADRKIQLLSEFQLLSNCWVPVIGQSENTY